MEKSFASASAILCLLGLFHGTGAAQPIDARKILEKAATEITFYGVDLDANPSPVRLKSIRENYARFAALRNQPCDRKDLIDLLKHQDPRVRTLAAFVLTERGDAKALPFLVPLAKDTGITFRSPHSEHKTVGDVVSVMIWSLMSPSGDYTIDGDQFGRPGFKEYWAKRKDRDYCAGWLYLELRANANTGMPIGHGAPRTSIRDVRARIDKLPEPDRTFTLLWLRQFVHADLGALATDDELIAGCKKVGPDKLVKLLRHEIPTDDPDMQSRKNNNYNYRGMMTFILKHAKQVLRAEDADVLLECARRPEHDVGMHYPPWYVAVVQLNPGKAKEILAGVQKEIAKAKITPDSNRFADLAQALWFGVGEDSLEFTVEMFYQQQFVRWPGTDRRSEFIQKLNRKQPIDRKLIAAIVNDKRLDTLDSRTLYLVAFIADFFEGNRLFEMNFHAKATHPLGDAYYFEKDRARREYPKESEAFEKALAGWRQTLRKAFAGP